MYNLGDQFKINQELALMNPKQITKGNKYRITVLTERLLRLEYNEEGIFEDRPTNLIWYRTLPDVPYIKKEDASYLELETEYFKLTYTKEKNFNGGKVSPMSNLKVSLKKTDRVWYYGHPEIRNFGAPGSELVDEHGKVLYRKALYSIDGFASIDDSKTDILNENGTLSIRENAGIDIYLFCYNKDFDLCLKDYFALTGKPALIPRYALGNWWSRNITYNDEELKQLVDNFSSKEIPLSVLLLDKDWHKRTYFKDKHLMTGFTWNTDLFHAPSEMINYLHLKGIRLGLNISPMEGFYPIDEYYEKAKEYLGTDKNGVIPFNVFDPKTVDVYLKLFIHPLDAMGADFFWIDYFDKKRHNELQLLKHYQFFDMMRNYKRRPMVLAHNSLVAPHRYPVLYSGKTTVGWDTLKRIPLHNATATNIGVSFWSHDIGGYFKGTEDNELYIRYVQLGVFSPILKFGAEAGKYYKREPWRWSIKTYEITKDYLQLRHRLIPYLYTEAYKYHQFGTPLIEPIYYKYPDMYDDPLYKDEYYFGSAFFVSPITKKKDYVMNRVVHKFFLPDGIWYDFVTGKKFPGAREYTMFFKDQDYPVFVRAGSIIPLGDNDNINDTTPPKNLEIQIFPGQSNLYKMYEDDGVSDLYRKGFYLLTSIDYNYMPNNYTVIVRALEGKSGIVPETRNYKFRFRNTKQSDDVIVYFNDTQLGYESYVEGTDFVVEVKNVNTIGQLTINCKGKNIEIDAVRLINEEIEGIISDLQIETETKEKVDAVLFNPELPIKKKRIEIRKMGNKNIIERKFMKLFLKLLEYVNQV